MENVKQVAGTVEEALRAEQDFEVVVRQVFQAKDGTVLYATEEFVVWASLYEGDFLEVCPWDRGAESVLEVTPAQLIAHTELLPPE